MKQKSKRRRRRSAPAREPIAIVCWTDASQEDGPLAVREMEPLIDLETVGWLVREDRTSISVAQERGPDGRYREVQHIPRVNITRMKVIRA